MAKATFWSHHKNLSLVIGEKVTKFGDKEIRSPLKVDFKDNMFSTEDESLAKQLRAHQACTDGKVRIVGSFHETDEKTDREALLKNKKLVENGTPVDLGMANAVTQMDNKRRF